MSKAKMHSIWEPPPPSTGMIALRTLRSAVVGALVLSAGVALAKLLVGVSEGRPVEPLPLLYWSGQLALVLFTLLVPCSLAWSTRAIRDRSFTWLGLAATFFGLAMLVVFFAQIAWECRAWFIHVPRMVELKNQELEAHALRLKDLDKMKAEMLAEVRKELDQELARTPEGEKAELRKFYEDEVIPQKLKDFQVNSAEDLLSTAGNRRPDTSALSIVGYFLSNGPSSVPQDAGIFPALLGSLWLGLITILFAVPVGVGAAIYLEEFKSERPALAFIQNIIQVNINNLAGVPSVVFGILGAFVFVELIFKPMEMEGVAARNVLGGGLTLGLLTLPVVIVSAQESIRAVPNSIRQGAYALGATRWQVIWHNVLPMARPGIMTGTILSLSRAIGEAAPLVMFGALLFVNQNPTLLSRFTIMPMQIFGWSDRPAINVPYQEESVDIWKYNAAMASLLLLVMLLSLNGIAIWLRNRAQKAMRY